jgi:hypothetical protein
MKSANLALPIISSMKNRDLLTMLAASDFPLGIQRPDVASACGICKTEMTLVKIPNRAAVKGGIAVAIFNLPLFVCPRGHEARFISSGFLDEITKTVESRLPRVISSKNLFSKRFMCCKCRMVLTESTLHEGILKLHLGSSMVQSLRIEVATPVLTCLCCKQQQLRADRKTWREIREGLAKALIGLG